MIATTNTQQMQNTQEIEIENRSQTNISKKTTRGRKPKNTIENTKQKITETIAKQIQEEVPNVENIIHKDQEPEIKLQTFHHNFSEQIAERFMYFATLHRYDDRKTFKEAWQKWIQEEDVAADIQHEIHLY